FSFDSFSGELGDIKSSGSSFSAPAVVQPSVAAGAIAGAAAGIVEKEWLVLVFISASNDLGALGFAENDINEMESGLSSDAISVVVESSILRSDAGGVLTMDENSQTLMIAPDNTGDINSPVIYDGKYGNYDMGDVNHLIRSATYNIKKYPAKKVMLVVWNHGSGEGGIAYDDISGNHISGASLGNALKQINSYTGKKLDIFATDACLMQTAKVAYELSKSATVIVGSEETIPGYGFPYDTILSSLSGNPSMDAAAFGKVIVQKYQASYSSLTDSTLSALDSSYFPGFVQELNGWVNMIRSSDTALTKIANGAIPEKTFNFATKDNKDFCDFIDQLGNILPADSEIMKEGRKLRDFVSDELVISHKATNRRKNYTGKTCGLAIYLPEGRYSYKYNSFMFARDTYWDDFIKDMGIKLGR
ncbi:MAG: clostripain-related cysteine peptidase, partial [Elusimicrobiota bacterium]|nr:clostripain-related cysteine peptidase [Elusimicrobiota bacterium]